MSSQHHSAALPYRPDIDGLRAVAVIVVILFHCGVPAFSGGYVGVDVFFVVSGYLITGLLHDEISRSEFSVIRFYERRARRILPALFLVLAVVTFVSTFILIPIDEQSFARSLIATTAFASNIQFWSEAGYFDLPSAQKPLLHTWSLGVEEQFYLLFPFLLWATERFFGRRTVMVFLLLCLLSFVVGILSSRYAPSAGFYLLHTRFWELLIGAMLALGAVRPVRNKTLRELLALAGISLIGFAVFGFNTETPFPGAAALLPCLGTAALIQSGAGSAAVTNRMLSVGPLVFVGLISYSLYLWHWPLLVFAHYALFRELAEGEVAGLMVAAFLLALLSWRFVERPFRGRHALFSRPQVFALAGTYGTALGLIGLLIFVSGGIPWRFDDQALRILAEAQRLTPEQFCFNRSIQAFSAGGNCPAGSQGPVQPSFILWGDSHARAIEPAVSEAARRHGRAGYFIGRDSCIPLVGMNRLDNDCRAYNDAALNFILATGIREVILDGRWALYTETTRYGSEEGARVFISDDQSRSVTIEENNAVFRRTFEKTLKLLQANGLHVTIVGPVPEVGVQVPEGLVRNIRAGVPIEFAPSRAAFEARQARVFAVLNRARQLFGVTVIYPHTVLCSEQTCSVIKDGLSLYLDDNHLSLFGSRLMSPLFDLVFSSAS